MNVVSSAQTLRERNAGLIARSNSHRDAGHESHDAPPCHLQRRRSMTTAEAPPPPLQMLAHPIVASFCLSTWYRVQMMRAPDVLLSKPTQRAGRQSGGAGVIQRTGEENSGQRQPQRSGNSRPSPLGFEQRRACRTNVPAVTRRGEYDLEAHPMGCPRATAPPLTFTREGSRPRIWERRKEKREREGDFRPSTRSFNRRKPRKTNKQ